MTRTRVVGTERAISRLPAFSLGVCRVLLAGCVAGCAHVPAEAVKLSYQVGQDLPRLHESYDNLIHERFEDFRARRKAYLEEVWAPDFLSRWIEKGRLVDIAKGTIVWSFDTASFIKPTPGNEKMQLLTTINEWSAQAVGKIEKKRKELLDPLDRDEKELRRQVQEAFTRVMQANAYITAHLQSLRNVEEAQDEALKALGIKDLRDSINKALAKASDEAAAGLDKVRKADGLVDKAKEAMNSIR